MSQVKLTPDNDLSISGLGYSCASSSQGTSQMCFFFFGGVFSNLISSPLMKLEVCCILKGFSRLIVGFDVQ